MPEKKRKNKRTRDETPKEKRAANREEEVMNRIDDYTDDPDTLEDFAERQRTGAGSDQLRDKLARHNSQSPGTSGGDIDASWESDTQSGEESVGGTVATPDQDVVEELGEAVGVEYDFDEPLDTAGKLEARDRNRWEMDPESAAEQEEELKEEEPDLEDMLADADVFDDEDLLSVAEGLSDLEEEEEEDENEDIKDEGYTITDADVIDDEDLIDEDEYDIESGPEEEDDDEIDDDDEEPDDDDLYDEEIDDDEFEFDDDDFDDLYDDDDDY